MSEPVLLKIQNASPSTTVIVERMLKVEGGREYVPDGTHVIEPNEVEHVLVSDKHELRVYKAEPVAAEAASAEVAVDPA